MLIGAFVAAPSLDRDYPAGGGGGGEVGAFRSVVVVGEGDRELHLGCGKSGRGFVATAGIQILFAARFGFQWQGILTSWQRMGDSCKCVQGLPRSRNAWEVRWTLGSIDDIRCHCCLRALW